MKITPATKSMIEDRYVQSTQPELEDDEVQLWLGHFQLSVGLQVNESYIVVNEYGYDSEGNLSWMRQLKEFAPTEINEAIEYAKEACCAAPQ